MDSQSNVAFVVRAERKAGIGIDGGVTDRNSNCDEIALLSIEHFCQLSALLQPLTGKPESVELLPINLRLVNGGGILLLGQEVVKAHLTVCQQLLILRLLTVPEAWYGGMPHFAPRC